MKYALRLTQLYVYLLLFCYWLLVSASKVHHQANIYKKKLKMLVHLVQKRQVCGIQFTFVCGLYIYYQSLDVLSVVSNDEILYCEYYGWTSKIFIDRQL
jgi:hypothetical protein